MALVKAGFPPSDQEPAVPDLTMLLADLGATEAAMRRAAARGLAAYPEAALPLCDRLEVETSPSVRALLFTSLIHLQSPAVAERLTAFLRSDDAPLRNAAIEALQEMPDSVAPHLERLLADEDSDVRIFAVNILATLCHVRAPQWLASVVRSDPHVNVCAAALDGLAEIGGPEVLDDLEELRGRFADTPFMEFAIDAAMQRIRGR